MRRVSAVALVAVLLTRVAVGATDVLGFSGWTRDAPLTGGWMQTGLDAYGPSSDLAGGAYFNSAADRLSSPDYAADILSVSVELATTSSSPTRTLGLYASEDADTPLHVFAPTSARRYERQVCELSGSGLRAFVLKCTGGSGNWAVRSIEVSSAAADVSVRPVREIAVVGRGERSFDLVWDPVEGACSYLVSVWTNGVVGASPGVEETVTWQVQENVAWDDEGVAVVGTTVRTGSLGSAPLVRAGDCRVTLEMARETKDDTKPVAVMFARDGVVSHSNEVSLATGVREFRGYSLDFTGVPAGSQLVVGSSPHYTASGEKRFGRVAVRGVSLVWGYDPGLAVFDYLKLYEVVTSACVRVENVAACPVCYSVVAQFEMGTDIAESLPAEGSVDMSDPPWMRCWRVGAFMTDRLKTVARRTADFESLRLVEKRTAWTNGRDGDGVRAFVGEQPADAIGCNSGSSRTCGLYATTNVLSVLGTGTSDVSLVLPVRLDAPRTVLAMTVSYVVHRTTDANPTKLSFAYRLADVLGEVSPVGDGWVEIAEGASEALAGPEAKEVSLPASALRRSAYLLLRWRVPQSANSSMMGLSDLAISVRYPRRGTVLTIR